jgi:two-component system alkaline phosphatase synthesis response regulator PhoP
MNPQKQTILLVEDEENLHQALKLNLEMENYCVESAYTGLEGLKKIKKEYFDVIILDLMLPEMDGLSLLESIRVQQNHTPVLILSAKANSGNRVDGLKKGADDYLTKPFNLEELLLRIKILIEKSKKIQDKTVVDDIFKFGNFEINFNTYEATTLHEGKILLSKKEIMLLKLLIDNKNNVVPRERILQTVWGYNVYPNTRTIDNFILSFRKYFEQDSRQPQHFLSIRGIGYKFVP